MPSQVQRVLMTFRLIFVFETVVAELARALLLYLMRPVGKKSVGVKPNARLAGLTAIPLHFQISSAFWDSTRT